MNLDAATVEEVIASLARVGTHEERRLEVMGMGARGEERLPITSTDAHRLPRSPRTTDPCGRTAIADTPSRLMGDIEREGIRSAAARASKASTAPSPPLTGIEAHSPHRACALLRGTGYALDNLDVLKRALMYIR